MGSKSIFLEMCGANQRRLDPGKETLEGFFQVGNQKEYQNVVIISFVHFEKINIFLFYAQECGTKIEPAMPSWKSNFTRWVQKNGPPCDKSVRYAGCFLMSSIFWLKTKKTGKTNIFWPCDCGFISKMYFRDDVTSQAS